MKGVRAYHSLPSSGLFLMWERQAVITDSVSSSLSRSRARSTRAMPCALSSAVFKEGAAFEWVEKQGKGSQSIGRNSEMTPRLEQLVAVELWLPVVTKSLAMYLDRHADDHFGRLLARRSTIQYIRFLILPLARGKAWLFLRAQVRTEVAENLKTLVGPRSVGRTAAYLFPI